MLRSPQNSFLWHPLDVDHEKVLEADKISQIWPKIRAELISSTRILSDYAGERKGDGNVVHKSIKMWRAEQKICYAAVPPCFSFGCAKTFSIFQRAFI